MQVNYCSQEKLVYGTAKCRVPEGSLGISLREYRLAIRCRMNSHQGLADAGCKLLLGGGQRGTVG